MSKININFSKSDAYQIRDTFEDQFRIALEHHFNPNVTSRNDDVSILLDQIIVNEKFAILIYLHTDDGRNISLYHQGVFKDKKQSTKLSFFYNITKTIGKIIGPLDQVLRIEKVYFRTEKSDPSFEKIRNINKATDSSKWEKFNLGMEGDILIYKK